MPNLINYTEEEIDVLYNPLQYSGRVAASMKLVQSNCLLVTTSVSLLPGVTFNGNIVSYEGTAIPYKDGSNIRFSQGGIIYNILFDDGTHLPIAEGQGPLVYDSTGTYTFYTPNPSYSWVTQDTFHYNITNGFNDLGDGIKRPYSINGEYTNPACNGHNGAETKVTMPAFRPELEESPFHYNQNDYSSTVLSYDDLVANNYYIFLDENNGCKDNLITLLPIDISNLASGQKTFRREFKTFR